jgi:hypothetical protein
LLAIPLINGARNDLADDSDCTCSVLQKLKQLQNEQKRLSKATSTERYKVQGQVAWQLLNP